MTTPDSVRETPQRKTFAIEPLQTITGLVLGRALLNARSESKGGCIGEPRPPSGVANRRADVMLSRSCDPRLTRMNPSACRLLQFARPASQIFGDYNVASISTAKRQTIAALVLDIFVLQANRDPRQTRGQTRDSTPGSTNGHSALFSAVCG